MRRRSVVGAFVGLLVAPRWVSAQQALTKAPRIGCLSPESSASHEMADLFRDGLKQLGYVEGQNIQIEYRWAAGQFERLPGLARN